MQRRHLITSSLLATLIIVIAGIFLGSYGDDQVSTRTVNQPAPTIEDKARFEQLAAVLNQSATGRDLLDLKEFYRITVQFETGNGSTFNQDANRILLDANHDVVKAGLYFAHEMHHAITLHQGKKADLKTESRQGYIENKLMEEAEGMLASIQVKIELEEIGVDMTGITLPLEEIYRQAYQDVANRSTQSAYSLSAQQLHEIGMTAGEQALFGTFANGKIRTSNTREPYTAYYGNAWDKIHPFKAFVADLFRQGTPDRITSVLTKPRSDMLIGYSGIISAAVTGKSLCWEKTCSMLKCLGARRISSFVELDPPGVPVNGHPDSVLAPAFNLLFYCRLHHFYTDRTGNIQLILGQQESPVILVNVECYDAIAVLVGSQQVSSCWIDGEPARCLALG